MNDQNLKQLMADVATERLELAKQSSPGTEEAEVAFKQGVTAFNAYTELVKAEDAHEELVERRELEKQKQDREESARRKERISNGIIKGLEIGAMIAAPVVGYFCNKKLAAFLCEVEQFETFTTTAGKSLGRMFKFGK